MNKRQTTAGIMGAVASLLALPGRVGAQAAAGVDIFGVVSPPPGVAKFGGGQLSGLITFLNNTIKFISIVAGIFALFNLIMAGFSYLQSSGNPKAAEQAGQQILMSIIGLIIIVSAVTITGIASLLIFGDAMFILNPTIPTP